VESWIIVALCWLLFVGTHIALTTSRIRSVLVARLGTWGFGYLFSAIAAVSFGLAVHALAIHQGEGPPGLGLVGYVGVRWLGIALLVSGVALSVASFWALPVSALALLVGGSPRGPRGLERITRHPFFVGTALLGVGHVLLASRLVGVIAFSGLALLSIGGAIHQDAKLRSNLGQPYLDYLRQTSIVPFAAILRRRQRFVAREIPWLGFAAGLAVAFALRSVHDAILGHGGAWVIGVAVVGAGLATLQTRMVRSRRSSGARAIHRAAS
jgi:uncharacterized membrane protein